jgi:hypothetical protein
MPALIRLLFEHQLKKDGRERVRELDFTSLFATRTPERVIQDENQEAHIKHLRTVPCSI